MESRNISNSNSRLPLSIHHLCTRKRALPLPLLTTRPPQQLPPLECNTPWLQPAIHLWINLPDCEDPYPFSTKMKTTTTTSPLIFPVIFSCFHSSFFFFFFCFGDKILFVFGYFTTTKKSSKSFAWSRKQLFEGRKKKLRGRELPHQPTI